MPATLEDIKKAVDILNAANNLPFETLEDVTTRVQGILDALDEPED